MVVMMMMMVVWVMVGLSEGLLCAYYSVRPPSLLTHNPPNPNLPSLLQHHHITKSTWWVLRNVLYHPSGEECKCYILTFTLNNVECRYECKWLCRPVSYKLWAGRRQRNKYWRLSRYHRISCHITFWLRGRQCRGYSNQDFHSANV